MIIEERSQYITYFQAIKYNIVAKKKCFKTILQNSQTFFSHKGH